MGGRDAEGDGETRSEREGLRARAVCVPILNVPGFFSLLHPYELRGEC